MSHINEYKGCVVIQGPVHKDILNDIRRGWSGYKLIFSTWPDTNLDDFHSTETVVISEMPENRGVFNFQLQRVSTIAGMKHAQELGWERAIKWRSDMIPKGGESFWNLFDTEYLNFYMWADVSGGYLTDYFMEGKVDEIMAIFDVENEGAFPEWNVTRRVRDLGLWDKLKCIGGFLGGKADVKWETKGFWLSENINHSVFTSNIPENWGK
jgi:hypothetical protein